MPLYRLMRKNPTFQWDKEADDALRDLKKVLLAAPLLAAPADKEPIMVYVAASERVVSVTPSESDLCKFEQNSPNPHRNDSKVPTRHFRAGGKRSNNITQQSSMGPTE